MTENRSLFEQLHKHSESDYYPYHMPGHKRQALGRLPQELLRLDITEIDGFDNLHQPEGIICEMQNRANMLYGSDETYYLVNGSTCGILSAISAALEVGGHLLMARGCHKSAYHGAYLRELKVSYLYADPVPGFDFDEAITARQVEEALDRHDDVGAVLIVSPTYEGRIADVAAIAEIVHKRGIPLIVDEAHGAHLGFAEGFAKSSCTQGADLVIHSVHKTLPAMTQTALLHVNGSLIDRARLKRFLHIYQSSSPSYVLMSGIQDALQIVENSKEELFTAFYTNYQEMYGKLQKCRHFRLIPFEDVVSCRQDVGKLILSTTQSGHSGQWLYDVLREKYHLQCEMSAGSYCLAMFTLADTIEAFERMTQAVLEIDAALDDERAGEDWSNLSEVCRIGQYPVVAYPLSEAWDQPWELCALDDSVGKVAADFVNLYPPGVPLLVPGEVITDKMYEVLVAYQRMHLNIQGVVELDDGCFIRTLK